MSSHPVYLKPNVLVEPLFNQWYAWSHLIAPVNAALYIANVHTKIMESFVAAPQVHAAAYRNPALIGGPFVNYDASRVSEVAALLQQTRREQAHMLALARAYQSFERQLVEQARGHSLEPLYAEVPEALKGYVELVYDLNSQPALRLIEGLLYRSPYYNPAAQSVALSLLEGDARSFVLSTPRLADAAHVHLSVPLADARLDELFRMKRAPQPLAYIAELFAAELRDEAARERFATFFTESAPAASSRNSGARYDGDGVRIRYFGHACLLIETREVSILTDPVVSYEVAHGLPRYSYADLPATLDYVVITHNHQDHCMLETLLQLRPQIKNLIVPRGQSGSVADPSLKLVLQALGFRNVQELDELETLALPGGDALTGVPFLGEHGDLNIRTKLGYLIQLHGRQVLAVADSNNLEPRLYDHLRTACGPVDVLFVGMECAGAPLSWVYGGLLSRPLARPADQSRRLNGSDFAKARDLAERLQAQQIYVYAMGQEPWLTHVMAIEYTPDAPPIVESDKLLAWCQQRGLPAERLKGWKELLLARAA